MSVHALTQEDLRWLACPVCRGTLLLDLTQVQCNGCQRKYPVIEGLPVLIGTPSYPVE